MEDIFIKLLNMSITASYFALAVILIRIIFKKMPKWITCLLWGLVALRLVFPFSFESILSLIPSSETVPSDIMMSSEPHITSGIPALNSAINPVISESFTPDPYASANPLQIIIFILSAVWVIGVIGMFIYATVSYILIRRKTSESIETEKGIFICDNIDTPFILGVIKPKIFIPSYIDEQNKALILAHERAHIKRKDHIWKPLAYTILSVYWFNPVMWAVFVLLCRDIEAACDEKVIKEMDTESKKIYSEALITCSSPKKYITACPLAFGETGVKQRIKNILSYKKPTFWIIISALIVSIILSACFMTNPAGMRIDEVEGYNNIFDDVEKIQLFVGEAYIYTTEDTKPELSEIKKVRLEKSPVKDSTDTSYRIEINDEITINIDESFSSLYLNNYLNGNLRKSESYSIRNPEVLKNLFSMSNYITGMDDIYITLNDVTEAENGISFNVTWHNKGIEDAEYGEMFSVERITDNGEYEEVPFPDNFVFLLPAYILKADSTAEKNYYCPMTLPDGQYRFVTTFRAKDGKSYYTKASFVIGESTSDISGIGGVDGPTAVMTTKTLTLDDVIRLSKKGDKLTWNDFEEFTYYETGSGLYIREYVIDERFSLSVGGTSPDTDAWYFYLHAPGTYSDAKIDIRSENPEEFINLYKDAPVVNFLSYSQRSFPVDDTGENFQTFIDYGCFVPTNQSNIRHFPVVMIESRNELDDFVEYFNEKVDLDRAFQDMGLTFREVSYLYDTQYENFFESNVLFITYMVASNEDAYFEMDYAAVTNKTLTLSVNEINWSDAVDNSPTGWFIISEISKDRLGEIEKVSAFVNPESTEYSDDLYSVTYTFKASSNEIVKPSFTLYENGKFVFTFHPSSSYIGQGTYETDGDTLTLTTDEGFIYCFKKKNGAYFFNAENSCDEFFMSDIKDGSEFRY